MKLPKETDSSDIAHGRWYNDACGTAFGMELVGERWALLIVRELMLGGRRFNDLRASLPGISAKVLTERLEKLEEGGVLARRKLPPPASVQVYELTEWGYLAEPLIQELGRWAATSVRHDHTLPLSPVSLMLSFRTMLDKVRAKEFDATIGFEVRGESFVAELRDGQLPIRRGDPGGADLIFRAPAAPLLAAVFYGKVPVESVTGEGVQVEGDRALRDRFIDLFHLPRKVG
ncbi:MAG TPA: helix-turn-helix domain-containing protein [Croceibacterium sp.]|nr:helix-turn-helix domain-containing protein [Croceibacterium sp.]